MEVKILVLYYSMYGNTYILASEICKGIEDGNGIPILRTVPEILPQNIIEENERIKKAKEMQKDVKVISLEEFENIDGLLVGSPTRFGNMCAQMRNFLDQTGNLWVKGILVNKPVGFFTCSATIHGGQETTLISMMFTFLHHGAIIVGVPYTIKELLETQKGGTPYGASAVVGLNSDIPPSEVELKIARKLGERVTIIARKLKERRENE
ncbi:MAG: NAD(P)H:quinone oxidoreductase [bacterium]|nr:NAD(P)H:quinone oxidoreductase [bacterium]MCX7916824.1 NAD(P)H:quinone oxidoreductase [bacterium]MDW8164188.1 NAD(P)H:quinone oxidoreductase [Candidatus Omnitrophota bacterium]